MRFLIPILALACWAKSPSEKITILQRLPNAVIDLGLQEFEALTQQPLDYTLYVLFTTSNPEHNCEPCEAFEKEYKLVAELAKRSRKTENVYFAKVDFVSAPQVFQKLQLNSAPLLYRYYAKSKKHDAYPIEQYGTSAEVIFVVTSHLLALLLPRINSKSKSSVQCPSLPS